MSKDTDEIEKKPKKNTKISKKEEKSIEEKDKAIVENDKKFHKIKNKSVQDKIIQNIKSFISKIIDMQEKVKKDEEEEKKQSAEEIKPKMEKEIKDKENKKFILEYYDLPYRYNETVVKILAQTPKRLFVYWDVSDNDKKTYLNAFGEHFFENTYPVLLVHNEDKNYTSEVIINDFANSWYLDISDSRDKYTIQLGRKFKPNLIPQLNQEIEDANIVLNNDYLFIAMSNKLEVPNDHILFEEFKPYVRYRNVKTHEEIVIDVKTTIYQEQIQKLYDKLYDGKIEDEKYDMLNPSSLGTSGNFRTTQ